MVTRFSPPGTAADIDQHPILTSKGVAALLGISVSTAQLWMENGNLPSWRTPGGHRRVHLSSVQRLQQRLAHDTGLDEVEPLNGDAASPAEAQRLLAVERSGLSAEEVGPIFDPLTWLAATVTTAPIALLTLLTQSRQLFLSRQGVAMARTLPFSTSVVRIRTSIIASERCAISPIRICAVRSPTSMPE